jgi:hypothetical protein
VGFRCFVHLEIIADNLSKAGWSWGCVSAIDSNGRTIWIADAHRDDGQRFVVRADEKLTAFVELETVIRAASGWLERLVRSFRSQYCRSIAYSRCRSRGLASTRLE